MVARITRTAGGSKKEKKRQPKKEAPPANLSDKTKEHHDAELSEDELKKISGGFRTNLSDVDPSKKRW